ncbi:GNAT family N-acetyltransferase [Sutcliffiella rhizosphaerae]|uniref:N-acetyltransferase domain-containing protein n=1 Tax=Sutcliffiella rhizosphaerae TaxID=2880967 RepID=A0ABM8YRY0_9BACI|nr:GNAT family N-acetyltransferase [Sutcliffiella rhizosphaerae]CAG9622757.1 hypothetical protein BACCIP111883_03548 [Sutcliffiella rhizosphaerae]
MDYEIIKAKIDDQETMQHLFQFYIYDFSEFIEVHVEENGRYSDYPYLSNYWTEDDRYPYLIKFNGNIAGFVLVRWLEEERKSHFSIAEFFIMRKYRRTGLGKLVAKDIIRSHKGEWEVFQIEKNKPAQLFWRNVIADFTGGQYTERVGDGKKVIQAFIS